MSSYENNLYLNHGFDSESSEDLSYLYNNKYFPVQNVQNGGSNESDKSDKSNKSNNSNNSDKPTGGFPPIHIVENKLTKNDDKVKDRQITTNKTSISIRDILKSKK